MQVKRYFLVSDENVIKFYGDRIKGVLSGAGYSLISYVLPAGEEAKTSPYLKRGYDYLLEQNFSRDNLIVAFGGGVVGDLAGFLGCHLYAWDSLCPDSDDITGPGRQQCWW